MTILPILSRELVVAARKAQLQAGRSVFAGILLAVVLCTFGAWYYWEHGSVSPELMGRVARQSFLWIVFAHAISIFGVSTAAALSIAGEKDRRTLDFLLATRLGNAEIVLAKFASSMILLLSTVAAGLPVMLLLSTLGSVDLGLILVMYVGLAFIAFFVASLGIWVSSGARDSRHAMRRVDTLLPDLADWALFRCLLFPSFGHPFAGLRQDRECLAPGQQSPVTEPEDRPWNRRAERSYRRSCPDERIASSRRRSSSSPGRSFACAGRIGSMSATTAGDSPGGSPVRAGDFAPGPRSVTTRSSGGR